MRVVDPRVEGLTHGPCQIVTIVGVEQGRVAGFADADEIYLLPDSVKVEASY